MFSKLFVALASAGVAASIPTGPVLVGHPAPYDETPKASLILPLVFVVEKIAITFMQIMNALCSFANNLQPYAFEYGVEDSYSGAAFGQTESSDATGTTGSYRVALPDGRTQVVTYSADPVGYGGYVADVKYEGVAHPAAPAPHPAKVLAHPAVHPVHPVVHPVHHAVHPVVHPVHHAVHPVVHPIHHAVHPVHPLAHAIAPIHG